ARKTGKHDWARSTGRREPCPVVVWEPAWPTVRCCNKGSGSAGASGIEVGNALGSARADEDLRVLDVRAAHLHRGDPGVRQDVWVDEHIYPDYAISRYGCQVQRGTAGTLARIDGLNGTR